MTYQMYPQFKCCICDHTVYADKTLHLEDHNTACNNCFYRAQEILGTAFLTKDLILSTQITEETYKKERISYVNMMRRYINKHQLEPFKVLKDFVELEVSLSKSRYNKKYKELNIKQLHDNIHYLKSVILKEYFKDDSTESNIKKEYNSTEYFTNRDYNSKLKVYLK